MLENESIIRKRQERDHLRNRNPSVAHVRVRTGDQSPLHTGISAALRSAWGFGALGRSWGYAGRARLSSRRGITAIPTQRAARAPCCPSRLPPAPPGDAPGEQLGSALPIPLTASSTLVNNAKYSTAFPCLLLCLPSGSWGTSILQLG